MSDEIRESETIPAREGEEAGRGAPYWAVIEIFGHRRHVGVISEAEQFGVKMLRIDVPGPAQQDLLAPQPAIKATYFYGGASVFGITPITEERGRAELARMCDVAAPARLGVRLDFDDDFDPGDDP
ncbi:MAG TPA: hypothetical protein VMS01_04380 [Stellaceae bacterium]|nr:hypothetical protein [Stellaceae bacterium]